MTSFIPIQTTKAAPSKPKIEIKSLQAAALAAKKVKAGILYSNSNTLLGAARQKTTCSD